MDEERKQYKTFYGSRTGNSCAYCWKHHLAMTPAQLKRRGCLGRQCDALKRFDHPFWEKREETKAKRRARKERLERQYLEVTGGI
jgi:hypothetical protein